MFGEKLFLFNITSLSSFRDLELFIFRTNSDGHIEDVNNIFIIPNLAINASQLVQHSAIVGEGTFNWYTLNYDIFQT